MGSDSFCGVVHDGFMMQFVVGFYDVVFGAIHDGF